MDEVRQEEILENLRKQLEEKKERIRKYDNLISEAKEELWELKVRAIVCDELRRKAYKSACRSAGIVKLFMVVKKIHSIFY